METQLMDPVYMKTVVNMLSVAIHLMERLQLCNKHDESNLNRTTDSVYS